VIPLFYGGFVVAAVALLIATIPRTPPSGRLSLIVIAFCGLFYEKGCFATAEKFGSATGSGGPNYDIDRLLFYFFLVAAVWGFLIMFFTARKMKREWERNRRRK
jgi:formate hydrogenlyase subunit 3/multisubunit Na+/H+ antiporter MnhD subunit